MAWSTNVTLSPGLNTITVVAENKAGLTRTATTTVTYTPAGHSFSIEATQKIEGEASYTTAELPGKVGQTVDYQVVVQNTGTGNLEFTDLSDAGCTSIIPSGTQTLASGESKSYTCSHRLTDVGTYQDSASIEANEGIGKEDSNALTVDVAAEPSFTIELAQRLNGEGGYTAVELVGSIGQTVEYSIIVKNTGNVPLELGKLKDTGCSSINPAGTAVLPVGGNQAFTCSQLLSASGTYGDEASIEGSEGTGTRTSNRVAVEIAAQSHLPPGETHHATETPNPAPKATAGKVGATKLVKGNITLVIACTGPAGTSCAVKLGVSTLEKLHGGRPSALAAIARSRTVTLGSASATIPAGSRRTITIKLNATGRALLARFHRLPMRLTVTQRGTNGTSVLIAGQSLTITAKHS